LSFWYRFGQALFHDYLNLYKHTGIVPRRCTVRFAGDQTNLHNGSSRCITAQAVLLNVQLKAMPNYGWTCLACGHANRAEAVVCVECSCPASASFKQISAYRENYVAKGGKVLPGAGKLPEEGDNEILEVFAKMVLGITKAIFSIPKNK
jgi:hypothetical protein